MNSREKKSLPVSKGAADSIVEHLFAVVEKQKRSEMNDAISNRPEQNVGDYNGANGAINLSRYRYTLVLIIVHESKI